MMDITDAINALHPENSFVLRDDDYSQIEWVNAPENPATLEQVNAKLVELQNAEPMRVLREERNRKLAQTDWRASSDLTLSSEWSTYRQALRDLPSTSTPTLDDDGNLENVTWPDEPT